MVSFGKRIPDMPLYALFLIPLLAVMALRLIAMGIDTAGANGPGGMNAPGHERASRAGAPRSGGECIDRRHIDLRPRHALAPLNQPSPPVRNPPPSWMAGPTASGSRRWRLGLRGSPAGSSFNADSMQVYRISASSRRGRGGERCKCAPFS